MSRGVAVEASAPGKLILFGEHAVVYGATAVAGALSDLRIFSRVNLTDDAHVRVTIPDIRPEAKRGAEYTQSWTVAGLADLWLHLRELCAAASVGDGAVATPSASSHLRPVKPTDASTVLLEALLEGCNEVQRKGVMPPLFMCCAVLRSLLLTNPDGSAPEPSGKGVHICIHKATLPIAAGLGSSAAFSVATAASLVEAGRRGFTPVAAAAPPGGSIGADELGACTGSAIAAGAKGAVPSAAFLEVVNRWAYASEMLFHGSPSGLDNAVATYGGAMEYRKSLADGAIHMLNIAGMPALRIVVTNTKVPKETSKLVAGVRKLRGEMPDVIQPLIDSIDAISHRVVAVIREHAAPAASSSAASGGMVASAAPRSGSHLYGELGRLARVNHCLLNALGVGHESLDMVVRASLRHGFTAKLTGAGGGGCAITLLPASPADEALSPAAASGGIAPAATESLEERVSAFQDEMRGLGYDCFSTTLGGSGVLIHELE